MSRRWAPVLAGVVAQYVPADPLCRKLVAIRFAAATGKGVLLSGSVVYFTLRVGLSPAEIGIGLSGAGFASLLSSLLFGMIADRVRRRPLLCLQLAVVAAGFALYSVVGNAIEYYVVVAVISFFDTGASPTEGAIVASLVPDGERVRLNAMMRSIFNVGFSVGVGIAAAAAGFSALLILIPLGSAVLLGAAALLVTRLPADGPVRTATRPRWFGAIRDLRYTSVVGLSAVLASHMTLLTVVLPLWALTRTSVPHFLVPLLLMLNTVFVVLFQVRVSKGAETWAGAARTARSAGLWIATSCAVVSVTVYLHQTAVSVVAIAAAALLLSMAEITQSASAWGLAFGLAPTSARAEYLGTFDLHIGAQNVVGPLVMSGLVVSGGIRGWAAIACAVLIAAWLIVPAARRSDAAMTSALPQSTFDEEETA